MSAFAQLPVPLSYIAIVVVSGPTMTSRTRDLGVSSTYANNRSHRRSKDNDALCPMCYVAQINQSVFNVAVNSFKFC